MKMNIIRYIMCALLVLGALGHLYGTFDSYPVGSEVFVWSLSATAFTLAVVTFNLLARSGDRAFLAAGMVSAAVWAALALGFGSAVGNIFDPRAIMHAVPSVVLVVLDATLLVGRGRSVTRAGQA
jgi:Na+/proline symporter